MITRTESTPATGKALHVGLWVVQVLLGAAFMMSGFVKLTQPFAELTQTMTWAADLPQGLVRFIGLAELLGGIGLILPAATRIQPLLTGYAAIGLLLVMVLAAGFHASRGEYRFIGINAVLGGLAAFVAWGRLLKAPIAPRVEQETTIHPGQHRGV